MSFVHGKNTYISLNGTVLSSYCNTSNLDQEADEHDVTCYGATDYSVSGGLLKGAFTMGGIHDDGTAGPKAVIEPLLGTVVTLIRGPEGNTAGQPKETVSVLVKKYTETNPVAGMVTWSCDMTKSGAVTRTNW